MVIYESDAPNIEYILIKIGDNKKPTNEIITYITNEQKFFS